MSKRKRSFNDDLKAEFSFLSSSAIVGCTAFCSICKSTISVAHGGRSDINDHIATKKHKAALSARASSSSLSKYYTAKQPGKEEYSLAAEEGTCAYHTVCHNQSFRSVDCTSQLIRKMFEPKFVERVFSLMNTYWSDQKSRLSEDNLKLL